MYEQINMPRVQLLVRVLQRAETANLPVFSYQFSELTKLHAEAKVGASGRSGGLHERAVCAMHGV
jgi:hypothetical protein